MVAPPSLPKCSTNIMNDNNNNDMMNLMLALEPTPLPEHYTPAAVTMPTPIPSFSQHMQSRWDCNNNMQQQMQLQQPQQVQQQLQMLQPQQTFSMGMTNNGAVTPMLQPPVSNNNLNGFGDCFNQVPGNNNNNNNGMQQLAQSLGSQGVASLLQAFRQ